MCKDTLLKEKNNKLTICQSIKYRTIKIYAVHPVGLAAEHNTVPVLKNPQS